MLAGDGDLARLDGQFCLAYRDPDGALCLARDHPGIMPLFFSLDERGLGFASEYQALETLGYANIEPVVPGSILRYAAGAISITSLPADRPAAAGRGLGRTRDAVVGRAVSHGVAPGKVGLLLSGGVDSALLAVYARRHVAGLTCLTLDGPDVPVAEEVCAHLRIANHIVVGALGMLDWAKRYRARPYNQQFESLNRSLYAPSCLLARAAAGRGLAVVLSADGVDEVFGGYDFECADEAVNSVTRQMIDSISLYSLDRLDEACMYQGVQPRVPFLSRPVIDHALGLDAALKKDKRCIRDLAERYLPRRIARRPKCPMQVSTGSYRTITGRDWINSYVSQ